MPTSLHMKIHGKKNMKKRIKIIKHLRDCLEKAENEYSAVYEELQALDSDL